MDLFARVVVGIDGTDWGFEALRQALALMPAEGSVVNGVTALDLRGTVSTGFEVGRWRDLLAQEAEQARSEAAGIIGDRDGCSARVERGTPVDVLRRARDRLDATMLALGGRRSSRLLGIVMGDTATELLHDARCSVLLARPSRDDRVWEPASVVVGVDGSAGSLAALAAADDIATRLGGTVDVVGAGSQAADHAGADWAGRISSPNRDDPVAALLERSERADLVVVGSRGLHGLQALGSVSERVAHQARCSVLVVHTPA
ncbi:MAG TPA: universal stress protein [Gaiellaceae bacterium]